MSLNPGRLARAAARGPFTRVLVAAVRGSAPREAGAQMLVWPDGFEGTIGGGALEWQALATARAGFEGLARIALGPSLGQCCGGAVTLVYERFDAYRVAGIAAPVWARRIEGAAAMPAAVAQARVTPWSAPRLLEGWLLEPVSPAAMPIWIWGAGHVGRALAAVLAPLDQFAVTWADFDAARFGGEVEGVQQISDANPVALLAQAPRDAQHLVLTHSHPLDLALCHAILGHGFASLGLIGSASKAARFAARLAALGHGPDEIARINCPIGEPELGKQPQAIAVGVAAALLRDAGKTPKRDA